jgi:hypothetical protein
MLLHHTQELDNDLRAWSDEDLSLSRLLGIVDAVESIIQNTRLDHIGGGPVEILKSFGKR